MIQQIEFIEQLKAIYANYNATDAGNNRTYVCLHNFRKIKKRDQNFLKEVNSIINNEKLSRSKS